MKLRDVKRFVFGTLRGRLIMGVALVHAVMMTLFIMDLTIRQRAILLNRQVEEATALAQSLSTSAAVWIASDDISGLQELVESQHLYPDLIFAIITDEYGHILAHTNPERKGLYLLDLPKQIHKMVLVKNPELVDVIVPAHLGSQHIGWVRISISCKGTTQKLTNMTLIGVLYAFIAIVIGSFIAWFMGTRITRRLYAIQNTINEVRSGNASARSHVKGTDEAASIATEFNIMLDSLGNQYTLLSALINSAGNIVIFSLDKKYCYTAFNEKHRVEMKKVWNADIRIGMNLLECMQIPELRELAKQSINRALNGESFSEVQHQSQPDIYYELCWNPIFQNNEVVGITAFVRDITSQKQNEEQILKLNRIYAVLSNINQAIVRIHEPNEMMKEACRIAVEYGKFKMAWTGMVNDQTKNVDVVASFGDQADYLNTIDIDLNDTLRNAGPTGAAVKTGRHAISNNIMAEKNMVPWHKGALKYGYKSSASFPLIVHNKVIGAFNLYSDEISFFQEEDIKLLDEMAIDISFALEFIEAENKRKLIEKSLRESEEKYRILIQKIQAAVVVHGADTKIITCNAKAQELLGLSQDQLLGKTSIDTAWHFFREDYSVMPFEEYPVSRVMNSQKELRNYIIGVHGLTSDNDVWVLVNADPVFNRYNQIIQVIVTFSDITEQKRTEARLAKTTDRLNEAQHISHVGSWELDIVNNILIWSDEIYQIFEIDPDKFGASYEAFLNLIHPDDREAVNFVYTNSLKTRKPYFIDHRLLFPGGRIKYVHEQCKTHYDGDKPIRSTGIVQDITDRKRSAEEIRILNQQLEQRVIERTAQLEATNKELEAFSYSVSHDLRAPLRGIDGFSQILLDDYHDKVDEQGKNYLQRIRMATQRMSQLIDDMLKLSRISRTEMNMQQVNLSEIVNEIAGELHENQPERVVEFIIQQGIVVQGDHHLLRIVLENLLGNAWKFTSKHTTSRIEFGGQQENEKTVYFIRDDGAGFNMKYAEKLFGAFQRLHLESEFQGTGVGLATVQRIIHLHGGKVWAEGEIEKGATFYFTIPSIIGGKQI